MSSLQACNKCEDSVSNDEMQEKEGKIYHKQCIEMTCCHHCGEEVQELDLELDNDKNTYHKTCLSEKQLSTQTTLTEVIRPHDEKTFDMSSTDLFRPALKQIGESVFEIKRHIIDKDGLCVKPTAFESPLAEIKDDLLTCLEDKLSLLRGRHVITHEESELHGDNVRGFIFIAESLPVALNFESKSRPQSVKCDIFILLPYQPAFVLTMTDDDKTSRDVKIYNTSVMRGLTLSFTRFLNMSFKTLFGALHLSDIETITSFNSSFEVLIQTSKTFLSVDALSMNPDKYDKIVTAFCASIAETTSVFSKSEDKGCKYLRFLTKQQGIVILENLNRQKVNVTTRPESGATTLMLEIARRLSRLDKTLLVVKSEDNIEKIRLLHSETLCGSELQESELLKYKQIVDETQTIPPNDDRKLWTFTSDTKPESDEHVSSSLGKGHGRGSSPTGSRHHVTTSNEEVLQLQQNYAALQKDSYTKDIMIEALKTQLQAATAKTYRGKSSADIKKELREEPLALKMEVEEDRGETGMKTEDLKFGPVEDTEHLPLKKEPVQYKSESSTGPLSPLEPVQKAKENADALPLIESGVTIKQEPIDVPDSSPHSCVDAGDGSDPSDDSSSSRGDDFRCPLCTVTCTSETHYKQHFLSMHVTSSPRERHDITPYSHQEPVAGPSTRPDGPLLPHQAPAGNQAVVPDPSLRPDGPRPPVDAGPHGMKRVSVIYLECPACPKRFKTERGCNRHLSKTHTKVQLTSVSDIQAVTSLTYEESNVSVPVIGEDGFPRPVSDMVVSIVGMANTPDSHVYACPAMILNRKRVHSELAVLGDTELVNTEASIPGTMIGL